MVPNLLTLFLLGTAPPALTQGPSPDAPTVPALTELEQAWWTILQLRTAYATVLAEADACRAQLGPLRAKAASEQLTLEEATLKVRIEAGHPGFRWNPKTGQFTTIGPPPPAPKKKPGGRP